MFYYRAVIGDAALGGAGAGAVILTLLAILKYDIFNGSMVFCLKILTMQSSLEQHSEAHSQFPLSQMNPA